MTSTITINGQEIELYEQPKHKAVQQVQDIMTSWMMEKIDMSTINQDMALEDAIKQALMANPTLAAEITPMQRMLPFDQTIMLATNLSYKELQKITDEITEAKYRELYEASRDAMGVTAEDFFGYYDLSTSGTRMTIQVNPDQSPLEMSTNQP